MAHECFDDGYIAGLMNEHFVCVKVDREERPDVDQVYMEAVQMIQQQGGWPLNVFCLPDGRPFSVGRIFRRSGVGTGWFRIAVADADFGFYKRSRGELVRMRRRLRRIFCRVRARVLRGVVLRSGRVICCRRRRRGF